MAIIENFTSRLVSEVDSCSPENVSSQVGILLPEASAQKYQIPDEVLVQIIRRYLPEGQLKDEIYAEAKDAAIAGDPYERTIDRFADRLIGDIGIASYHAADITAEFVSQLIAEGLLPEQAQDYAHQAHPTI